MGRPARWGAFALLLALGRCAPPPRDVLSRSYIGAAAERAKGNPRNCLADVVVRLAPYRGGYPRATRRRDCVAPRNDHKLRVELPWADAGYVIVDFPEALYADHALLFLAHTNARDPSTARFAALPKVKWRVFRDGRMNYYRTLPGGVAFSGLAIGRRGYVDLAFTVVNHSGADLSDVRAQVCVLLKDAVGFSSTTRENVYCVVDGQFVSIAAAARRRAGAGRYGLHSHGGTRRADAPFVAVRSEDGSRAIVTVWEPCFALPTSAANPCIHSDPLLGDCPSKGQVTVRGRIYFVEGDLDGFYKALGGKKVSG